MNGQSVTVLIIVPEVALVGNEYVNAHRILRLAAVCGEPSQVVCLINHVEVVVGLGVERHAYVFGLEI